MAAESADALLHARVVLLREIAALEASIRECSQTRAAVEAEAAAVAHVAAPHRGRLALAGVRTGPPPSHGDSAGGGEDGGALLVRLQALAARPLSAADGAVALQHFVSAARDAVAEADRTMAAHGAPAAPGEKRRDVRWQFSQRIQHNIPIPSPRLAGATAPTVHAGVASSTAAEVEEARAMWQRARDELEALQAGAAGAGGADATGR
jgi:hypothetical protein